MPGLDVWGNPPGNERSNLKKFTDAVIPPWAVIVKT